MATYQDREYFNNVVEDEEYDSVTDEDYLDEEYQKYDSYEEPKLRKSKVKLRCTRCSTDWKSKSKLEKHKKTKHSKKSNLKKHQNK